MLDYGEILDFLAKHPPQIDAEREVHASLLELIAQCLRTAEDGEGPLCTSQLEEHSTQFVARTRNTLKAS